MRIPRRHQASHIVWQDLRDIAEVGSFGHELAQKAVGVLVRAALPGCARVAASDVDLQAPGKIRMAGHLRSSVIGSPIMGHAVAHLARQVLLKDGQFWVGVGTICAGISAIPFFGGRAI
jgi:hypothetical protein